jgi:uncharacterized RDD family membrane protein YckC
MNMEFNEGAKLEVENYLEEVLKYVNADDVERKDIEKELRSAIYESAEAAARLRGSETVAPEDVKAARADMVTPRETAESLMMAYGGRLKKAGFWSRLVAYIIDSVAICGTILVAAIPLLLLCIPFGAIMDNSEPNPLAVAIFLPIMGLTALFAIVVYFGYYLVLEGRFGYTIGKYLLGLRVLKTDGTKIGYKESLLRNISKYIKNFIIIDTLIMLLFFNKEKQRGFDKIADTIVVHMRA